MVLSVHLSVCPSQQPSTFSLGRPPNQSPQPLFVDPGKGHKKSRRAMKSENWHKCFLPYLFVNGKCTITDFDCSTLRCCAHCFRDPKQTTADKQVTPSLCRRWISLIFKQVVSACAENNSSYKDGRNEKTSISTPPLSSDGGTLCCRIAVEQMGNITHFPHREQWVFIGIRSSLYGHRLFPCFIYLDWLQ